MIEFVHTSVATRVVFGAGSIRRLRDELASIGIDRALALCSPRRALELQSACSALVEGDALSIFPISDPSIGLDEFELMVRALEEEFVGLVAYGGGEVMRIGKAVAANTRLSLVAIPTTYSGAEHAPNWYVGTGRDMRRGSGNEALPRTVIYDPQLTTALPPLVSAASGMNAMAHAVESLYGPDRTPLIEAAAEDAVRRLASALPQMSADPLDLGARSEILAAAWLAASYRAKTSLEHVAAQFIRHQFGLDHAMIHAIVLPYVVAFNASSTLSANERLRRALETENPALALFELNRRLGLPAGLREIGMMEGQLEVSIESLAQQQIPNPRAVTKDDLRRVLGQAFGGREPEALE